MSHLEDAPGAAGPHRQQIRDAITVEISFSVVAGSVVAALLFFVVAGPALLFDLSAALESGLFRSAAVVAAVGFVVRVVTLLFKLRSALRERGSLQ
ncbi:hypothetical protein J1792_16070 [Streptomyces triculaminicus]|uniref:Uncharacterized protein n=1 Tax=Streptomyces triculaminicus TaxID=2816232 RepID=A0A939FMD8_9ACTN|nr:DUF6332 family protein [Streptomyces triculaminicus]MBO0654233.1 hypothetical protein [Streptomyces triculaminicus]